MADPIDAFFDRYPPGIAELARGCRALVRELVPDAKEALHEGWKVVSYGHRTKFCAIAPHEGWVNLQFHAGADLEDPDGRLGGTGKSMRHVRVSDPSDLEDASIAALVRRAAHRAA